MYTAIIPILCNINPCMLFLLSIEKTKWFGNILVLSIFALLLVLVCSACSLLSDCWLDFSISFFGKN